MDNNGMNYGYENNNVELNNANMNYNSSNNFGVQKTNTLAVVGFILTFFPCISIIGWVLCIVALFQIKSRGEKGKGLAIAGIIWPLVATVIFIAIISILGKIAVEGIGTITEAAVCSNGPSYNFSDEEGSLNCGEEINGQYICEFTINGETKTFTCDMNE